MKNKVVSMGRSADRSSGREIATKSIKRVIALIFGLLLLISVQGLMAQTATAPSGTGTGGDPYLIATLNNLYWVTQNSAQWNKVYKQTANIDASSTNTWQDGGAGSVVGLLPIGNSSTVFNGEYNGQGFTILNLFINRPSTSPVGLFGKIYYGAVIQNLGLVSVNITGSNYSGALVGQIYRYATVLNCYSTGSVSGGAGSIIGGLIGQIHNYDCLYQNLTISKCYSTCNVSGSSTVLGGLIGEAISYWGNLYCGPVIITDCYAMGSVTGAGNVGGFIGGINDSYATDYRSRVEIRNCYSKGLVTASSNAGGFAGYASAYPVTGCYWDTQTSGQATSAAGTGKTTVQMNTQSTFSGWDFSSTWGISAYNSGYPYLQYQPATPSINSVTPGGGVLAGGTTVVLTGYAFTGATLVKFGANNATSFTVNSATQITAVAPAGSLGQVDITVTTPLGTNSSDVNNHFTYFQGVIYVNASATGANNGSSWTDAYTSLQTAMTSAFSSQQIWVAAGTYKPTATTDRTISFVMKEGVAIYGGFAGTETLLTDRAPSVNVTILSGEIGAAGTSDNSYHVVQGPAFSWNTTTSILDGFTITAGYYNGTGGGVYIYNNPPAQSVTISNCKINGNYAASNGGGVYASNANASFLLNCVVSGNTAATSGGGIYTEQSNTTMANLSIYGNTAQNTASSSSEGGGGMYLYYGAPVINNTIIAGNAIGSSGGGGKQFYFNGNTGGSINYSCYNSNEYGGMNTNFTIGTTNISTNPGFVNAAGGNFALYSTSPCIDAGDNTKNSLTTDIRAGIYGRKLLGTDHTQAGTIDMGAYEFYSGTDPVSPTKYVNYAATGSGDGTSWANAYTSLQTALNNATFGYIWVAKGTYYPSSSYSMPNSPRYYHFEMKDGVQILSLIHI